MMGGQMEDEMKKTKTTTKAKAAAKPHHVAAPAAPVTTTTTTTTTASQPPSPAPATKPALMRTRLLTPAQKVVAELIRFLKIDAKRPYGRRGRAAILELAQRATQAARQESKTLVEVIPTHQRTFVEAALARLQQPVNVPAVTTTVQ